MIAEFVCPALGFMEFLHVDWLIQIIAWQRPSGCYSGMKRKTSFRGIAAGDDSKYEYVDDGKADTGHNAAAAINGDTQQAFGNVAVDETVGRLPDLEATHTSLNRIGNVNNPELKRPSNKAGPVGEQGMLGNAATGRQRQWFQEQRGGPLHQVPLHDVPGGARKLSGFKTRRLLVEQTLPGNRALYTLILFFLSFPWCRGEAGHSSVSCSAAFVIFFHCSLLFVFSLHFLLPLPFSDLFSHSPPILAVVFLVFCNLLVSLSPFSG